VVRIWKKEEDGERKRERERGRGKILKTHAIGR
jgi:hypothetical protein